jgi:tripartite-type tricarboxylate transporter receptor subunit TctC
MMSPRHGSLLLCLLALLDAPLALLDAPLALLSVPAVAQDYPAKPVRLIVPFAAGGPADLLARAIAPPMSAALRQSVVIDNRVGAGGVIGVDAVAKAAPDGYTIGLTGPGAMTIVPFLTTVPYDAVRDLAPITLVGRIGGVIVASPKSGFKSIADLVSHAKANPGQVNFASAGAGTSIHLAGELLALETGIKLVHVPYRGAAPAVTDLLAGHVQLMLPDASAVLEHIRAGRLTALAVTGAARSPFLPELPTMVELGYPRVQSESWYGLIAPVATPPAIRTRLHEVTTAALQSADIAGQIERQGSIATPSTPAEFARLIVDEQAKWKQVVQTAGIKIESQ